MVKKLLFVVLAIVFFAIANSSESDDGDCDEYENRVYLFRVGFSNRAPFSVVTRFLENSMYDQMFSIAGGDNAAQVGISAAFGDIFGKYNCLPNNYMRLSGLGFFYPSTSASFLENGAIGVRDTYLKFSNDGRTCNGTVQNTFFDNSVNPFSGNPTPLFQGAIGHITCSRLDFTPIATLTTI